MKQVTWFFVGLLVLLLIGVAILRIDFNRLGASAYYTQIVEDGRLVANESDSGYDRYYYQLPMFQEKDEQTLELSAAKNLRKGAYLKVFVKSNKGVTSYQEVKREEIPPAILEKIERP